MAFSSDTIGFYLQAEDQLTPVLEAAGARYTRFVRDLEKLNKRAVQSVSKGMGAMSDLVRAFGDLPKTATKSYREMYGRLRREVKPLKQPVELVFGNKRAAKALGDQIATAVRKALGKMTLRMQPAVPRRRVRGFDTSESLRASYRNMTQPPDMTGVPRFNKGGINKAGKREGIDDVLALIGKNEMILPAKQAKLLKGLAGRFRGSKGMATSMADMLSLSKAIEKLTLQGQTKGLSSSEKKLLGKLVDMGQRGKLGMIQHFRTLSKEARKNLNPELTRVANKINQASRGGAQFLHSTRLAARLATGLKKSWGGIAGHVKGMAKDVKFLGLSAAIRNIQRGIREAHGRLSETFGGNVQGFFSNANQANKTLGLDRKELQAMKFEILSMGHEFKAVLDPTTLGETFDLLADAGARGRDEFRKLLPVVGLATRAMNISGEAAADMGVALGSALGMSQGEMAAMFEHLKNVSKGTRVSASTLAGGMAENIGHMEGFLLQQDAGSRKAVLGNMATLSGALSSGFGDKGNNLAGLMARALGGDDTARQSMANLTGLSHEGLAGSLKSGDLGSIIKAIRDRVQQAQGNQQLAVALAEGLGFPGTPAEFQRFATDADKMLGKLTELQKLTMQADGALARMAKDAGNNQSAFASFANSLQAEFLDKGGKYLLDWFNEFNPLVALSWLHLGKMGFSLLMGTGKLLGFGKALATLPAVLTGVASAIGGPAAGTGLATAFGILTGALRQFASAAVKAVPIVGAVALTAYAAANGTDPLTMALKSDAGKAVGKGLDWVGDKSGWHGLNDMAVNGLKAITPSKGPTWWDRTLGSVGIETSAMEEMRIQDEQNQRRTLLRHAGKTSFAAGEYDQLMYKMPFEEFKAKFTPRPTVPTVTPGMITSATAPAAVGGGDTADMVAQQQQTNAILGRIAGGLQTNAPSQPGVSGSGAPRTGSVGRPSVASSFLTDVAEGR